MARTKTNTADAIPKEVQGSQQEKKNVEIPPKVDKLLKLYPQYKKLWVTQNGFVHQEDAPEYLTHDAVLYENKYYQP